MTEAAPGPQSLLSSARIDRATGPAPRTREVSVVVGVGGGLGGALASALARRRTTERLVGLARRKPDGWTDGPDTLFLQADVTDEASIAAAAAEIAGTGRLTRVIVATGLLHGDGVAPEKTFRSVDPAAMARLFAVNATGPALVAKHLLPLMSRETRSVFAALSARVGSISDNRLGGWYGYRASKAALNMLIATLAIELRRTHPRGICVALHPGTVETRLSAAFPARRGDASRLSPQTSAEALLSVMDALSIQDTGRVFAWDGTGVPW